MSTCRKEEPVVPSLTPGNSGFSYFTKRILFPEWLILTLGQESRALLGRI